MDPITREVISSSLLAYADEMTNNFWRTSYSYMNYEMRDYAVGLVDSVGRIVTQSRFTHPAFTADLGFVVNAALKELGDEGIEEGDVIVYRTTRPLKVSTSTTSSYSRPIWSMGSPSCSPACARTGRTLAEAQSVQAPQTRQKYFKKAFSSMQ